MDCCTGLAGVVNRGFDVAIEIDHRRDSFERDRGGENFVPQAQLPAPSEMDWFRCGSLSRHRCRQYWSVPGPHDCSSDWSCEMQPAIGVETTTTMTKTKKSADRGCDQLGPAGDGRCSYFVIRVQNCLISFESPRFGLVDRNYPGDCRCYRW